MDEFPAAGCESMPAGRFGNIEQVEMVPSEETVVSCRDGRDAFVESVVHRTI